MPAVRYSISLDAVNDMRLVRWLDQQANVSATVRDALYAYVDNPTVIENKLDQVLEMIRNLRVIEAPTEEKTPAGGEPEKARRGLDAMKARFKSG